MDFQVGYRNAGEFYLAGFSRQITGTDLRRLRRRPFFAIFTVGALRDPRLPCGTAFGVRLWIAIR